MKFFRATSFLLLLVISTAAACAQNFAFTRDLYVGAKGEDVRALQAFLNTDSQTRVAESGVGSQGNETDYFGPATKRAVIKFQEKYRADILDPAGLSLGTGYFGSNTRGKIAALMSRATVATSTLQLQELSQNVGTKDKVLVMFPSQYSGNPGTMISISGTGFTTKENTVYFGESNVVEGVSSWGGTSITLKVPQIPKGIYPLYVKNANGQSNTEQWFIVTDGVSAAPVIQKVTPLSVTHKSAVTISGSGFLPEGNRIMVSGVGLFRNVLSNDGNTLSFVVPQNVFPLTFSSASGTPSIPLSIYVLNENGISNKAEISFTF